MPRITSYPMQYCHGCSRERDCTLHPRASFPPEAAKKWLKRTCIAYCTMRNIKPACSFTYQAGFGLRSHYIGQGETPDAS